MLKDKGVYLGFDFGYKRIGLAVGQRWTCSATALPTLNAKSGIPDWNALKKLIVQWRPLALIVGLPTAIDESELYTTKAARRFAQQLRHHFPLPVYMVDERLSTVEAREKVFEQGGYRQLKKTQIDGVAACIILEQWLHYPEDMAHNEVL